MKNNFVRAGAVGSVATLALLAAAPGYAATVVAQADATAIEIAIAGNGQGSGQVRATASDDGTSTTEGETQPPISVLGNQGLLNAGTLSQDAAADVVNRNGLSAACAGVAGEGASIAEVGDSDCLTPGQPVGVTIANLDLSEVVVINPQSALAPLGDVLNGPLAQLLGAVTAPLSDALAGTPLGDLEVAGTFDAIQARCTAAPGTASGTASIANASLGLTLAGQSVQAVQLPANPAPNTPVVTDLDQVVNVILDGVEVQLREGLDGVLDPLGLLTQAVQDNIVDTVVAQVADQLEPLEQNVLDITLNEQTTTGTGQISVTALDLQLLPAIAEAAGASAVSLEIGQVSCGPNGRVTPGDPVDPTDPTTPGGGDGPGDGPGLPDVPTVIDAGAAADGGALGTDTALLGAGALALAGAAGLAGHRRLARR